MAMQQILHLLRSLIPSFLWHFHWKITTVRIICGARPTNGLLSWPLRGLMMCEQAILAHHR